MKKESNKNFENSSEKKAGSNSMNRRKFIGGVTSAAVGLTVVPRHVLGGSGFISPSDKVNIAYIGTGTQGLRELPDLLEVPEAQVVAVCDPQKYAIGYYDWSPKGLLNQLRETIGDKNWMPGGENKIPGGRDCGQQVVEGYYKKKTGKNYKCAAYADFRELLEKEDLDGVQVMTPDHLHGIITAAALKRGVAVSVHKPLSNRLHEGKKVIDLAFQSDATTHLQPWDSNGPDMPTVMEWINNGAIGQLKEIHNWSFRPVWPQYAKLPTNTPKLPDGFDWDLWLGPEAERPYHPHYTNMVFRGWYDFGGGSMADMGHYSLWTVFEALKLGKPTIIEPNFSSVCDINDNGAAFKIRNDFSFPFASKVRFKYPAAGSRPTVDLVWYDGGNRPPVPQEFYDQGVEFPSEGMMFVGDKDIILTRGFKVENPYLLSKGVKQTQEVSAAAGAVKLPGIQRFVNGIKAGKQIEGGFRQAWPITEAVNLYAAALRSGRTLFYDAGKMEITNDKKANAYLDRNYRKGWSLEEV